MFSIKCFLNLHFLLVTVWTMKIRLNLVFFSAKATHWEPAKMTQFLSSFVPAEELLLFIELLVFPVGPERVLRGMMQKLNTQVHDKEQWLFLFCTSQTLKTNSFLEVLWNGVGQMAKAFVLKASYTFNCCWLLCSMVDF